MKKDEHGATAGPAHADPTDMEPVAPPLTAAPGANCCNNVALRKATRNLGQLFDNILAPSGLRAAQFGILVHIEALDRPSVKMLAAALVMDVSALSHTLKPLIRDGLVVLAPDRDDRRSKRVGLTPAGRAKCAATTDLWREAQARFDAVLGAGPARQLRETLMVVASEDFSSAFRGAGIGDDTA